MSKKLSILLFVGVGLAVLPAIAFAWDMNCGHGQSCDNDGYCQDDPDFICGCPGDEVPSCGGGGNPQGCLYAVVCWNGPNECNCAAPQTCEQTGCSEGFICNPGTGACEPAAVECSSNSDCFDGNSCTDDICNNAGTPSSSCSNPNNGSCNAPSPSPSPPPQCTVHEDCDDGKACTNNVCSGGVCNTFGEPCSCGDGACTGAEDVNNCPSDCVPPNQSPQGFNDGLQSGASLPTIWGWTADPDVPNQSIDVHLYYGPQDNNTGPGCTNGCQGFVVTANVARAGLPFPGNHGFTHLIPSPFKDGQPHRVRAYAINVPAGTNPVLLFSGDTTKNYVDFQIFQCSDGIDNETPGDGLIDWPADTGCTNSSDDSEIDPSPVINSFNAAPASITSGATSTLSWTTTNATTASIDQGIGSVAVDGSQPVSPATTTTYTLSAFNGEGVGTTSNTTVTVTNNPPVVQNVSVQEPDYCLVGPSATLAWQFTDPNNGDSQTAYQVQVDDAASFQSPVIDTGKILSGAQSHFVGQGVLQFSTIYRSRVRVWDEADAVSGWQTMTSCTGPGCQQNGTAWRTPTHRYPSGVSFTFNPPNPLVNEVIQFAGAATCFDNNNNPVVCTIWQWIFGDGGTAATQNPTHAYSAAGSYQATLQVQDNLSQTCPIPPFSRTIPVQIRLPKWREVLPR